MRIQRDRARGWECVPSIPPPSHGPLSRPSRANPSLDPKAPSHLFLPCFPNFARERQIPGGNGFVFSFPHPHGALRQAPAWEWECPVGAGNSAGQIPKITKTPNFPRFPAQGFAQSQILCRNSFPPKPHTYKETQNSRFSLGFLTSLCGAPRGFPALLEPRSLSGVFLSLPDPNSRG